MSTPLFELHRIIHRYNGKTALEIDHCRIDSGAIIGLKGPNGSGKSTLLHLLGFVRPASQGEILFKGRRIEPFSTGVRHQVSLLPQRAYLLHRSVYDNLAYGLRLRGRQKEERRRVQEALELVGLPLNDFGPRPWYALSGGEAHRVALAARLALHPEVLLLDEPTASVDDASVRNIKAAIEYAHRKWGASLVIASHDETWLEGICDSRLHLYQGRSLGGSLMTLIQGPWTGTESGEWIRRLGGQQFQAPAPAKPDPASTAFLKAEQLSLHAERPADDPGRHCLEGRIANLSIERAGAGIKTLVQVDELMIPILLPEQMASRLALLPGRLVWLSYALQDVQWHYP